MARARVSAAGRGTAPHVAGVIAALSIGAALLFITPAAVASTRAVTQVRAVYRLVLTDEYFGPASAVCSRLTASGRRSFTAGGASSCRAAFRTQQHVLKVKINGVDDSGFGARAWRQVVNRVMRSLKVTVHRSHASVIGLPSGIPGRTTLVKVHGRWRFTSYPPSIQS